MNDADRKILDLADWLKTSGEQAADESWERLMSIWDEFRKFRARKERNARHYRKIVKPKRQEVLKGLNGRLKTSELSEIVLNGAERVWIKQGTEEWYFVNDERRARGEKVYPVDRDGGWYVDKMILDRFRGKVGAAK